MKESDWKTFSKMTIDLRERYLAKANVRLARLLDHPEQTETERFWNAHEKIREEGKILQACLDDLRRSRLHERVCMMLHYGMLEKSELSVFSEEFQAEIRLWRRE
jgi:hypothetical protein